MIALSPPSEIASMAARIKSQKPRHHTYACALCKARIVSLVPLPKVWCQCYPGGTVMGDVSISNAVDEALKRFTPMSIAVQDAQDRAVAETKRRRREGAPS